MWQSIFLMIMSATILFADLFPINVGNQWKFTYSISKGGWGGGTIDSGFVYWKITSVDNGVKGMVINIEQKKEIRRTLRHPTIPEQQSGGLTIDSVFIPPKETITEVTFSGDRNILYNQADSAQILVHELTNIEQYRGIETRVAFMGDSIAAVSIPFYQADVAIGDNCNILGFFRLAQDIGPVSFQNNSSACIKDYYREEKWELIDYKCDNFVSIIPFKRRQLPVSGLLCGNTVHLPAEYQTAGTRLEILQINGKCIWHKNYSGEELLTIPSNITMHSGCYLIRVISPKKPVLTRSLIVNR